MNEKTPINTKRRSFMFAAGASSAAAVGVIATRTTEVVAPVAAVAKPATHEGYRDSAHIRHYYDSARV